MHCSTYCKGRDEDAGCNLITDPVRKTECIKSCLDCRTPNKDFCFCPGIFPPPWRKLNGTSEDEDDEADIKSRYLIPVRGTAKDPEEKTDDVLVYSLIGVTVGLVIIGLAVFCILRFRRFRRNLRTQPARRQSSSDSIPSTAVGEIAPNEADEHEPPRYDDF